MKAHHCLILAGALLAACALRAPQPATDATTDAAIVVSPDLQVRRIDPDVWIHTSWHVLPGNVRYPSNGLIVRDGGQLILIDTAWGEAPTQALLDWIHRELRLPVADLIPTHHHDDRIGGWPVLAAAGVPLLATPQTLSLSGTRHITQPLDPRLTALEENQAITVGAVEVFAPGPAHSPDNLMVWLPAQRILFGGCAIKDAQAQTLGNVAEADLGRWPLAIERARLRYATARLVVPGHGEAGDLRLLDHTLGLLRTAAPQP